MATETPKETETMTSRTRKPLNDRAPRKPLNSLPAGFMDDAATLDDCYGCDPWDDENLGRHTASREGR